MKKIFTSLAIGAICMGASAQISSEGNKINAEYLDFVPGVFTKSGKGFAIVQSSNEEGYHTFTVYDDSFNEVKKFVSPEKPGYYIRKTYERAYNTETGKLDGEWRLIEDIKSPDYGYTPDIEFFNLDAGCDFENIIATQTLFNEDEDLEFFVPVYENGELEIERKEDRDGDGIIDLRVEVRMPNEVGYKLVSESGKVLASFLDSAHELFYSNIYVIKMGGNYFLTADGYTDYDDDHQYVTYVYSINRATTEIKKVVEKRGIKCSPTIARKSEVVNVTLGENNSAKHILVTSVGGKTVKRMPVVAGQQSVQLSTSGLPAGMYVVSTSDGKNKNEYCKIIIR